MAIEVTIHSVGKGTCAYSGKECEGITVSFADGTFNNAFVSTQTFVRLLKMKCRSPEQSAATSASAKSNGKPAEVKP